ncbi:Imm1 family immunity protein [Amycolatopsis orientalis]|uniref:Imm1 family immunity protein n=1 Tax=Amycolatopsis orientalis TaxID=31958 RepID=UPI0003A858D1|nr:Imm1 family immunity protein [Amycolatopsis orientalis]
MTLTASVPTYRDGEHSGESITLATDADVTRLAELLAQPWADTGSIQSAETVLDVHLTDTWGYLQYAGDAGYFITDGDPESPAIPSEADFPAGSGLPVAQVVSALREFVRTGQLPGSVPWRDA